jgi:hypothetical protein
MWVNHYGGITAHYDPKVSDYPLFTATSLQSVLTTRARSFTPLCLCKPSSRVPRFPVCPKDVLFVRYEDLKDPSTRVATMRTVTDFLKVRIPVPAQL